VSYTRFNTCFHPGFLLGLFSIPEDGGDMFFFPKRILSSKGNTSFIPEIQKIFVVLFAMYELDRSGSG
jgi:hypothetical protein